MMYALLLPLLLRGEPVPASAPFSIQDETPIQLWISNDRQFLPGDRAQVYVQTQGDGYLLVLHVDPEGYLRVLFPMDPDKDNFIRGGKKYEVRSRGNRDAFEADAKGQGTVYAAVSRQPFQFDTFVVGDHWDYGTLAPSRLSNDPEPELNELVRRMAGGDFDYDILTYDVVERAAYAADYSSHYYGSHYSNPWCYSFSCGHPYYGSLGFTVFFGRPYRSYYYDPYFYAYSPFYNPFFYDPYYYAPYYPRYIYPWRHYHPYSNYPYGGGYYGGGSYGYRNRYYGQTYTPYRDRRYDLRRAVNTVHYPPLSPTRQPATATRARRVIDAPGERLPDRAAPRRLVDNTRTVQGRTVEARRARPEDRGQERSAGEPRLIRREVEARRGTDGGRAEPRSDERRARPEERRAEPRGERPSERRPSEARPQRSEAPNRGGGRAESRPPGGGAREGGGSRPSNDGGRRHR
jgi:Domain of unknown function (DUF4384)